MFLSCLFQRVCPEPGCGGAIDPTNRDVREEGAEPPQWSMAFQSCCGSGKVKYLCSKCPVSHTKSYLWSAHISGEKLDYCCEVTKKSVD